MYIIIEKVATIIIEKDTTYQKKRMNIIRMK